MLSRMLDPHPESRATINQVEAELRSIMGFSMSDEELVREDRELARISAEVRARMIGLDWCPPDPPYTTLHDMPGGYPSSGESSLSSPKEAQSPDSMPRTDAAFPKETKLFHRRLSRQLKAWLRYPAASSMFSRLLHLLERTLCACMHLE